MPYRGAKRTAAGAVAGHRAEEFMTKEICRMSDISDETLRRQATKKAGRAGGRHRRRWTATGLLIGIPAVLGPYLLLSQPKSEAATIDATTYYQLISVHSGKALDVNAAIHVCHMGWSLTQKVL